MHRQTKSAQTTIIESEGLRTYIRIVWKSVQFVNSGKKLHFYGLEENMISWLESRATYRLMDTMSRRFVLDIFSNAMLRKSPYPFLKMFLALHFFHIIDRQFEKIIFILNCFIKQIRFNSMVLLKSSLSLMLMPCFKLE